MSKYRKLPVIIEAMRLSDANKDQTFNWITCNASPVFHNGMPAIKIQTLEGDMLATIGDWIIKGVNGEFYPCKHEIFVKTYEPVDEEAANE